MEPVTEADLKNQFLIAMPQLADPNFAHTLTYICEHNEEGAMGIVINRPMELTLVDVLHHIGIEKPTTTRGQLPVYAGGPVQGERGFVLHYDHSKWASTLAVSGEPVDGGSVPGELVGGDSISITTSRDILEAIANDEGPQHYLLALGYAGWGPGQLEDEMAANAWISTPSQTSIIFHTPIEQRWQAAARQLGIDLNLMSTTVGHS